MTPTGKNRIMILRPERRRDLRCRVQNGCGRGASNLDPENRGGRAPAFGVTANAAPVRCIAEMEAAIEAQWWCGGAAGHLHVLQSCRADRADGPPRLPAIYALRGQAIDGGLLSYGPETIDLYRRAAG